MHGEQEHVVWRKEAVRLTHTWVRACAGGVAVALEDGPVDKKRQHAACVHGCVVCAGHKNLAMQILHTAYAPSCLKILGAPISNIYVDM